MKKMLRARKYPFPPIISQRKYLSAKISKISDYFNYDYDRLYLSKPNQELFNIKNLISPYDFSKITDLAISESEQYFHDLLNDNRKRKFVQILDDISNCICKAADMADCIRILHPDPLFKREASKCCQTLTEYVEKLNTNASLYDKTVDAFKNSKENDELDRRILGLFISDFELSGVQFKDESKHKLFIDANNKIFHYGNQFFTNSHSPAHDSLGKQINWPSYYDPSHVNRRDSYLNFYKPIYNQEFVLQKMLSARHESAIASGFKNYSKRVLLHSMIDNCEDVDRFLEDSLSAISKSSQNTVKIMLKLMKQYLDPEITQGKIAKWDIPFALNAGRSIAKTDPEILNYLSLGSCMHGVALMADCLFNLELIPDPVDPREVPNPDVVKISVYRKKSKNTREFVGTVYCDFYQREGKPFQDCHYTIQGGKYLDLEERYQDPIVYLHLNLSKSRDKPVTLLEFEQIENLFHEWGHALHSMLGKTRYQHVTGTRCSTDLAEIPSTLFEILSTQPKVISEYARHWKTGKPLEDGFEIFSNIQSARSFGQSLETSQQLVLAMLDQKLHRGPDNSQSSFSLHQELSARFTNWEDQGDSDVAYSHRFTHLYNYGSKYHSYQVARSAAVIIYQKFFQQDPWNTSGGRRLSEEFLKNGGEYEGMTMISAMLGYEIGVGDLSRCLGEEITSKEEKTAKLFKF